MVVGGKGVEVGCTSNLVLTPFELHSMNSTTGDVRGEEGHPVERFCKSSKSLERIYLFIFESILRRAGSDPNRKPPVGRYKYVECPGSPSVSKRVFIAIVQSLEMDEVAKSCWEHVPRKQRTADGVRIYPRHTGNGSSSQIVDFY